MNKVTKASLVISLFEKLKDFVFHKFQSTKTKTFHFAASFCLYFCRLAKKNHENFGGLPCYIAKLVSMYQTDSYSELVIFGLL